MIEIVFGDSACGGLKMAQSFDDGQFCGGSISVIVSHADGSKPTEEEIQAAQQEAEERERLEWEKAIPMGGNPSDVYGFHYCLSVGDISENVPAAKRRQVLKWLYSIYPDIEEETDFISDIIQKGMETLKEVCSRISAKEKVRIWYSNYPDELCGMYWFMSQINQLDLQNGQVILVQLPELETDENGNVVRQCGWGGVKLGDWHSHLKLQEEVSPMFCKACADHWQRLQVENSPLRAIINGRLVSVPETLYDDFIIREIEAEADEFQEALIVGRVLGKYELGVLDTWISHRIETMIRSGWLIPITEAADDSPNYYRYLKKCTKN